MEQNRKEILQKIINFAIEKDGLTPEQAKKVTEQTRIDEFTDRFTGPLTLLMIEMEVEKYFGIFVSSNKEVKTFGDLLDLALGSNQ